MAKPPEWLYRVETDEMRTLLRASSQYARLGYDPVLAMQHQKAQMRAQKLTRKFENTVHSGVPTQYSSSTTGRALSTELPHDRPIHGVRPPSTAGKELLDASRKRETAVKNDDSDAVIDAVMGPRQPVIDPHKIPLSQLKGLEYHAVEDQMVVPPPSLLAQQASARPTSSVSTSALAELAATHGNTDRSKTDLPKPSQVLKRYKMFSVRDDGTAPRNAGGMMHPPGPRGHFDAPPMMPSEAVVQSRRLLEQSNTMVLTAPPPNAVPARSVPGQGALSHAILQNKLGSTRTGGEELPRGGSGLIVGDLLVSHDQLIPCTLVAAKWGRITHTEYGASKYDPCRMRVEVQPLYYESLIADVTHITGAGKGSLGTGPSGWDFVTEVQPSVFLVDIGSVNAAVHGHRPSNVPPPLIGAEADALAAAAAAASSTAGEDGSNAGTSVGAGNTTFDVGDVARAGVKKEKKLTPDEMREARRRAKKKEKETKVPSRQDVARAELRMAMDSSKDRANTLLLRLAREGNDDAIDKMFTKGYLVDYQPNPWYSQMAETTEKKKKEARKKDILMDGGGNAGAADSGKAAGADADDDDSDDEEVKKRNDEKLAQQIYVVPEVDHVDDEGNTALMHAAKNGWIDAVIVLLRNGADHRRKNNKGQTAFDLAKMESGMASMALHIKVPGAAERKRRAARLVQMLDDRTVLTCAQKGDMRRLQYLLLDCNHPVNATNQYGMTPLHFAVMRRDVPMMRFLCECGADVNARNNLGQSPLSLVTDATGDAMQARMMEALDAARIKAEKDMAQVAYDDAHKQERAMQEARLVRELKIITRGTAAAKAVQLTFSGTQERNFGPGAGVHVALGASGGASGGRSSTASGGARSPVSRGHGGHGGGGGGGGGGSTLAAAGLSGVLSPTAHGTGGTSPGDKRIPDINVVPISAAKKQAAMKDATALAESWNRHVLNYLALQQKEARIRDLQRAREARDEAAEEVANRRRETASRGHTASRHRPDTVDSVAPAPPGTSLGGRLHATSSGAAAGGAGVGDALMKAMDDPGNFDDSTVRMQSRPSVDSRKFETWARLRFGQL